MQPRTVAHVTIAIVALSGQMNLEMDREKYSILAVVFVSLHLPAAVQTYR